MANIHKYHISNYYQCTCSITCVPVGKCQETQSSPIGWGDRSGGERLVSHFLRTLRKQKMVRGYNWQFGRGKSRQHLQHILRKKEGLTRKLRSLATSTSCMIDFHFLSSSSSCICLNRKKHRPQETCSAVSNWLIKATIPRLPAPPKVDRCQENLPSLLWMLTTKTRWKKQTPYPPHHQEHHHNNSDINILYIYIYVINYMYIYTVPAATTATAAAAATPPTPITFDIHLHLQLDRHLELRLLLCLFLYSYWSYSY